MEQQNDSEKLAEQVTTPPMQLVFEALASAPRRKILAYLTHSDLTAGEIAARFDMSKPSISQHLNVLETAGLISGKREGQFIRYSLTPNKLVNTLNSFVQDVCPVGRPLKKESKALAELKKSTKE
ncbi:MULTISPECIES: metalloregulator ArsR/SmtB family transcription factor [unclassified Agrobacterium]|uniref:metalloregulator ArsR/SmtB family transcription factor n=1 Tax=unclassified Agrobacterium TaxID=2632611 RepID=UPI002446F121|nr:MULTISPECIES: metalloregulator ArsR/SmtB family transcription factor [unclassified Agrobacterium]MDH0612224.1 metalloregulator ArsR/SmtB family transcription factor [Agrobacterium sp. GD03872]MDH0696121.1 metalloregulator ArsR/SmtB family transcription factor [Agrobacterium sp. GD03871]MDH1059023.1 metalloregulator ArsR/SmtB family transcription factor [Agrobacterium sp. GD03992]MDH2210385.1 metalloregulator ArsR/SmtB family transcription factor [Agrobacterium sp. GD03643]MDH2217888.1 metal